MRKPLGQEESSWNPGQALQLARIASGEMVGLADFVRDADFAVGVQRRLHGTFLLVLSCFDKSRFIQALANRRDLGLALAQCVRACVYRVVAEHEFMVVRNGRAEHEFSIGQRLEFDRFVRGLESRQIALPQRVRN